MKTKTIGFIAKSRGRSAVYFYLRVSERNKGIKRDRNIFSFGTKEKALEKIKNWQKDISSLPQDLKDMGYDMETLKEWESRILEL